MLDTFLKVAYTKQNALEERNKLASILEALPNEELQKIASGEEKLAYGVSVGGGQECWLDRFKGSPLYEQALQLEQEELQMEAMDIQQRMQRRATEEDTWSARDAISLKKRILELNLRQSEAGGGMGGDEMEMAPEEMPLEEDTSIQEVPTPDAKQASAALQHYASLGFTMKVEAMRKEAQSLKISVDDDDKKPKKALNTQAAEQYYEDELEGAESPEEARAAIGGDVEQWNQRAADVAANPIKSRLQGAGAGGLAGGIAGGFLGGIAGRPGLGALAGGAAGALGGALLRSPSRFAQQAQTAQQHAGALGDEAALNAAFQRAQASKAISQGRPEQALGVAQKMAQADAYGRKMAHFEKDAFAGALMGAAKAALPGMAAGLKGAAGGLRQGAGTLGKAFQGAGGGMAGLAAAGRKSPTLLAGLAQRAGGFAQANPLAAAGLGMGALGAAGATGAALG